MAEANRASSRTPRPFLAAPSKTENKAAFIRSDHGRSPSPEREELREWVPPKENSPSIPLEQPRPPPFPSTRRMAPVTMHLTLTENGLPDPYDVLEPLFCFQRSELPDIIDGRLARRLQHPYSHITWPPLHREALVPTEQEAFEVRNGILRGRFSHARITPLEEWGEVSTVYPPSVCVHYRDIPGDQMFYPVPLETYVTHTIRDWETLHPTGEHIDGDLNPRFDYDYTFVVSMNESELPTYFFYKLKAELRMNLDQLLQRRAAARTAAVLTTSASDRGAAAGRVSRQTSPNRSPAGPAPSYEQSRLDIASGPQPASDLVEGAHEAAPRSALIEPAQQLGHIPEQGTEEVAAAAEGSPVAASRGTRGTNDRGKRPASSGPASARRQKRSAAERAVSQPARNNPDRRARHRPNIR